MSIMTQSNEQIAHDLAVAIASQHYLKSSVRSFHNAITDYDEIYDELLAELAKTAHVAV